MDHDVNNLNEYFTNEKRTMRISKVVNWFNIKKKFIIDKLAQKVF